MTGRAKVVSGKRDAEATRAAIFASARRAFVELGYTGAGVREIAAGAGVTAMMVNRYFGSKEKLFAEVVADTMASPTILTRENLASANVARTLAKGMVEVTGRNSAMLDGFQIMLKSAASKRAAEIARAQITAHHHRTLTSALDGPRAGERAALVLALMAGLQVMRQAIQLKALAKADPDVLANLLAPMIETLLSDAA